MATARKPQVKKLPNYYGRPNDLIFAVGAPGAPGGPSCMLAVRVDENGVLVLQPYCAKSNVVVRVGGADLPVSK